MARIRSLKPEFFEHDGLAELPFQHRLLFQGLWVHADREGRMLDRPKRIRAAIFPYDEFTDDDIDRMLWQLAAHRDQFIIRYSIQGTDYLVVTGFTAHQRPHPKEPPSLISGPEEGTIRETPPCFFTAKSTLSDVVSGQDPKPPFLCPDTRDQRQGNKKPRKQPRLVKQATLLQDDFALTETRLAFALGKGMTGQTATHEFEKFLTRNAPSTGKMQVDWDATWRTSCLNWVTWGAHQVGEVRAGPPQGNLTASEKTMRNVREFLAETSAEVE